MVSIAKTLLRKKLLSLRISYFEDGEINFFIKTHKPQITTTDVLELFCFFYIKSLHKIGNNPIHETVNAAFKQVAQKYIHHENYIFNLNKVAQQLVTEMRQYSLSAGKLEQKNFRISFDEQRNGLITFNADLVEISSDKRTAKLNLDEHHFDYLIPLNIFAFFNYLNEKLFVKNRKLKLRLAIYLKGLFESGMINYFKNSSGMQVLASFTNKFFRKKN